MSNDGPCRCPGYDDCATRHGSYCPFYAIEPSGLCSHCDVARYAAIGRAAERLHELLNGTSER